jgi:hypothetical protein
MIRSLLVFACCALSLQAGTAPTPPPARSDAGLIDPAAFGFGNRGFMLDSSFIGTQDYDDSEGGLEMTEWRLLAPLWKRKWRNIRIGASLGYTFTELDFAGLGDLSSTSLHTIQLQTTYFWQRPDSPWWGMGFFTHSLAGDLKDISADSYKSASLALFGYRFSDTFTIAGGAFMQSDAIERRVFPALGFIWRPEPFILQVTPPFIVLGVKPTEQLTLSVSAYPSGGAWDLDEPTVNRLNISGWQSAATISYKLDAHTTVALRAGVNFGGEIELYDANDRVTTSRDLDPAPFAALNLRWQF